MVVIVDKITVWTNMEGELKSSLAVMEYHLSDLEAYLYLKWRLGL